MKNLLGGSPDNLSSGGGQDLNLTSGGLDGLLGGLCEGVSLNGKPRGCEFSLAYDDLVGKLSLALGDVARLEECAVVGDVPAAEGVELLELDQIVDGLGVAGSHRPARELGEAAVEGLLASLKTGAGWATTTTLLSAHSETTRGTLSSGNAPSLALKPLLGARSRLEVVESKDGLLSIVQLRLVGLSTLPVIKLHCHGRRRGGVGGSDGGRRRLK